MARKPLDGLRHHGHFVLRSWVPHEEAIWRACRPMMEAGTFTPWLVEVLGHKLLEKPVKDSEPRYENVEE